MFRRSAARALAAWVLLVLVSAPGSGLAEPPVPPGGRGPLEGPAAGGFVAAHAPRLGLDDATLAAIREIVDEKHEQGRRLRGELNRAHQTLRELLSDQAPDQAAVMEQAETIGALELAERKNRLQAMLRIRALLTPEQRRELVRIREESRAARPRPPWSACQGEVARLCPGAGPGRRALACLIEHWDSVSEPCRSAFEAQPRRGPEKPDRVGPVAP